MGCLGDGGGWAGTGWPGRVLMCQRGGGLWIRSDVLGLLLVWAAGLCGECARRLLITLLVEVCTERVLNSVMSWGRVCGFCEFILGRGAGQFSSSVARLPTLIPDEFRGWILNDERAFLGASGNDY